MGRANSVAALTRPSPDQSKPRGLRALRLRENMAGPKGLPGGMVAPEQDPGLRVPRQGAAAGVPSLAGDGAAVQDRGQPVGAVPGDEAAVRADAPDGAWDTGAVPGGAR